MPTLTFNITQDRFDRTAKAILAWNEAHPENPAVDENDFAKQAYVEHLQDYITRYRNTRISMVQDKLGTCSDSTFSQVTGLLG